MAFRPRFFISWITDQPSGHLVKSEKNKIQQVIFFYFFLTQKICIKEIFLMLTENEK